MRQLLSVETKRMLSRRLPWIMAAAVASVIVFSAVTTFARSSPDKPTTEDQTERIEQEVARCRAASIDEWEAWESGNPQFEGDAGYDEWLSQFESGEELADENCNPAYFSYEVHDPRFCLVSLYEPTVQWRQVCPDIDDVENYVWTPAEITIDGVVYLTPKPPAQGAVPAAGMAMLVLGVILGASFIGAEYSAGTIETLLLWEPRRSRVLAAKLTVAAVVTFVVVVALLAFLVVVMLPVAAVRGSTAGADGEFWLGLASVVLRAGAAAAAISAIALSVSTVARNTVAGVVALLGYSAVSPALSSTLLRGFRPFDLTENLSVFVGGGEVGQWVSYNGYYESVAHHGVVGAAIVIASYVVVFVVVGLAVFRRRDVD